MADGGSDISSNSPRNITLFGSKRGGFTGATSERVLEAVKDYLSFLNKGGWKELIV